MGSPTTTPARRRSVEDMSIAVELEELRAQIEQFGTAYVLTVSDDGRAHSVAVSVGWRGDELVVPAGRTTSRNATARPLVALLWPPTTADGYSLIVDATFVAGVEIPGGHELTVHPTKAVLHRPAPSGVGSDCKPVLASERSGERI
jgi:hypothetical protein